MGLHFTIICDNCNVEEPAYAPRFAYVVKPNEAAKRMTEEHRWKRYRDGTILCYMCKREFADYHKENAKWLKEAQKDKAEQQPKNRGGPTSTPEEYRQYKETLKAAERGQLSLF